MRAIIPRKIKGFRDINPELNELRWQIINSASKVYQKYGFDHWDTPILEYADCLGKFLPDEETVEEGVYSFRNPEKEPVIGLDGREMRDKKWDQIILENHFLTLRYDLTAPLARNYAEQLWDQKTRNQLIPKKAPLFRRFQYGPVYRYEQKLDPGRFREFWQLDFDTVGSDDVSVDAEVCMVLADAMEAVGLKRETYIVKVNNRKILKGFLQGIGITNEETEQSILRVIDKLDKIGICGLENELSNGRTDETSGARIPGLKLDNQLISSILNFLESFIYKNSRKKILSELNAINYKNNTYSEGINELKKINEILSSLDFKENQVIFDPTLVRGMSYYTGPVFEVESTQSYFDEKGRERKVGSICGGGRFDDLVQRLLGIKVPATGASIGVDRLAELLIQTKQLQIESSGPVMIIVFDNKLMPEYQKIAKELRDANINTEIYYGFQKGLKKQLSYADSKNSPIAILLGEDEIKKGVVTVRDLHMGKKLSPEISDKTEWKNKVQVEIERKDLFKKIKEIIL